MQNIVAKKKILIVDDESSITMVLDLQLRGLGYQVVGVAHDAAQALALARETEPDLILMDIMLGAGPDGIEAAHALQKIWPVPVVYLTAHHDMQTVNRAAQTAPYGYLLKPIEWPLVRSTIEVALIKAQIERQSRQEEQWFVHALSAALDGMVVTDSECRVRFINPVGHRLLNLSARQGMGEHLADWLTLYGPESEQALHPHPVQRAIQEDLVTPMIYGGAVEVKQGARQRVDFSVTPIRNARGGLLGVMLVLRDAMERQRMEESLMASEQRFQTAFFNAVVGVALVAMDGRMMQMNPALERMLGPISQQQPLCLKHLLSPPDLQALERLQYHLLGGHTGFVQMELRLQVHPDPEAHPVWVLAQVSLVHRGQHDPLYFIYQFTDLTARKQAENELHRLANFDPLTQLMNRTSLQQALEQKVQQAAIYQRPLALMYMDLDHFKDVNDTLGHEVGDTLLQQAAERMRRCARKNDLVARLGGDEFVLVVEDAENEHDVQGVANKLVEFMHQPFVVHQQTLQLGASIGIALYPAHGDTAATLLRNADSALYLAKNLGRNQAQFYLPSITEDLEKRMYLESAMRCALELEELRLVYQPIFQAQTQRMHKVEALIRWAHQGRMISPAEFIPVAELSGVIADIGAWVLREACRQAQVWAASGCALAVAVNVSPRQFRDIRFLSHVAQALEQSQLPPERLIIEITEGVLAEQNLATQVLQGLRQLQVKVAIDDFGTGYSSLSYLKRFKPDILKIDQSFIRDMSQDEQDATIVRATIAMGQKMGMVVVAEGVETQAQLQMLQAEGCDEIQGFLLGRPVPPQHISEPDASAPPAEASTTPPQV